MLSQPDTPQSFISSSSWSDASLEKEYRRLLRATRMARGRFALYPIESNLPLARREALLARFRHNLEEQGQRLRHVALSRENWQLLNLPEMKSPVLPDEVVLVTGLENTPEMATAYGNGSRRPPFLALLNHLRETLRQCVPPPFLLWCPSSVYDTLIVHAPDFFDHAVGLFRFVDDIIGRTPFASPPSTSFQVDTTPASPTLVALYRQKLTEHPEPTLERATALLDLGEALYSLHFTDLKSHLREARTCAEDALRILAPKRSRQARYQWARGNDLLAETYFYSLPEDQGDIFLKAIHHFEKAKYVYERQGDVLERALTMSKIADILYRRGDLEEALRIRREEELPVYEPWETCDPF